MPRSPTKVTPWAPKRSATFFIWEPIVLGSLVLPAKTSMDKDRVLPKNSADFENGSSRGFPIIVVEHPAQFVATADAAHLEEARRRLDQFVLDALMIAPLAIIVSEGQEGGPQMSFAQEYQTAQTFFLN